MAKDHEQNSQTSYIVQLGKPGRAAAGAMLFDWKRSGTVMNENTNLLPKKKTSFWTTKKIPNDTKGFHKEIAQPIGMTLVNGISPALGLR